MEKEINERAAHEKNGWVMLAVVLLMIVGGIVMFAFGAINVNDIPAFAALMVAGILVFIVAIVMTCGFKTLQPNESYVFTLFGKYYGSLKRDGFFWVNPFMDKKKLSLRARNLDVEPIKVNDKIGNPILIGLVLVWRLKDTYKIQSDAALRQVAGQYAYDDNESTGGEMTLRSGGEEINEQLEQKLNERLDMAGIEVLEARINYLAYAPEIAAVMLRRQQASAIISAREKIVEGAVSMVHMALDKLSKDEIVELDEEKKAAMVSNLLVVLCADEAAQPVVNTGTLNH